MLIFKIVLKLVMTFCAFSEIKDVVNGEEINRTFHIVLIMLIWLDIMIF